MKYLLTNQHLKEKVRLLRLFSGLSQSELAKKLGGSQAWLSKVEAGKLELSARHLSILRTIFGISCDAILDGTIPYHAIALKMNAERLVPRHYSEDARIPIKCLYPFLNSLASDKAVDTIALLARKLSFKPIIFSDPDLLVNEVFLDGFLREASAKGCFSSPTVFGLLKENLSTQDPAQFEKDICHSDKFDSDFIIKVKNAIFNFIPKNGTSGTSGLFHQV